MPIEAGDKGSPTRVCTMVLEAHTGAASWASTVKVSEFAPRQRFLVRSSGLCRVSLAQQRHLRVVLQTHDASPADVEKIADLEHE